MALLFRLDLGRIKELEYLVHIVLYVVVSYVLLLTNWYTNFTLISKQNTNTLMKIICHKRHSLENE